MKDRRHEWILPRGLRSIPNGVCLQQVRPVEGSQAVVPHSRRHERRDGVPVVIHEVHRFGPGPGESELKPSHKAPVGGRLQRMVIRGCRRLILENAGVSPDGGQEGRWKRGTLDCRIRVRRIESPPHWDCVHFPGPEQIPPQRTGICNVQDRVKGELLLNREAQIHGARSLARLVR